MRGRLVLLVQLFTAHGALEVVCCLRIPPLRLENQRPA